MAEHRILVAGAGGRMGRVVIRAVLSSPGLQLAGGFEHPKSDLLGKDLGPLAGFGALGLAVEASPDKLLRKASAMIDFSAPDASVANARAAAVQKIAHVIGTTGFTDAQEAEIKKLASQTAIVKSGNMSLGVNLLAALVAEAAARLPEEYDIEIFEAHHRHKVDAPSGTALMLGRAAARARGVDLDEKTAIERSGARTSGDIGFSVMRGGGVIGDHDVSFVGPEDVITLSHRAIDRGLFAKGAIAAAKWAADKPPGLYSMRDVLGLSGASTIHGEQAVNKTP